MANDLISKLDQKCASADTDGLSGFSVNTSDLKFILSCIRDQERELSAAEVNTRILTAKIASFEEIVTCHAFSEFVPDEDFNDEIFEVFVGPSDDDLGRLFAYWQAEDQLFYYISLEDDTIIALDNVMYWRHSLPETDETFDFSGI